MFWRSMTRSPCVQQAENDHHVKDTYNYVTVQTDIRMPRRQFDVLADTVRQSAWQVKRPPPDVRA